MACAGDGGCGTFERMARSHARVMLEGTYGPLTVDDDGDLVVVLDSITVWVTVVGGGHGVRALAIPVAGVPPKRKALLEVQDANSRSIFARSYLTPDGRVGVEGCLPLRTCEPDDLVYLVQEVARTAHRFAVLMPSVHGGRPLWTLSSAGPPES